MNNSFRILVALFFVMITFHASRSDEGRQGVPTGDAESSGPLQHALSQITFPYHEDERSAVRVQLSADGRYLASRDSTWQVKIWDAATGDLVSTIARSDDRVDEMVFTLDGQMLVTAGPIHSESIRCWNVANGLPVGEIAHPAQILQVRDHQFIQAVGAHERILFQLPSGPIVSTTALRGIHNATPLRLSSDGQFLLINVPDERGNEGHLELYDLQRHERRRIGALEHEPMSAVLGRRGEAVAAVHRDGTLIHTWQSTSLTNAGYLAGHRDAVLALGMTPDELFLVSAGADGALRVWDLLTKREVAAVLFKDAQVHALSISGDGRRLAIGLAPSDGPDIVIWELAKILQSYVDTSRRSFTSVQDAIAALGGEDGHFALVYLLDNLNVAMPILEEKLHQQLTPLDETAVQQFLAELDHPEFHVRDRAYQALFANRFQIREQLLEAFRRRTSVATKLSLQRLLQQKERPSIEQIPQLHELRRTVYLLERHATQRGRTILSLLESGCTDPQIRDAAAAALERLQAIHPIATPTDNS